MTDNWEIVQGDFGAIYKGTVEDLDLSLCTATIKVWREDTILIDGAACSAVEYSALTEESYVYYTVIDGDFPLTAIIDGKRTTYEVMIAFAKDGYKEHDLGFEWTVIPAPPSS